MQTKKVALLTLEPTIGARKEKADENYASNPSTGPLNNAGETKAKKI